MPDTQEASIKSGPSKQRVAWHLRRRTVSAVVLAAVVGASSGLWWWASRDPLKLPASACWSVLDRDDLRRLVGDGGGTFTTHSRTGGHDDDESRFDLADRGKTCVVEGDRKTLLEVEVRLLDETFFHEYEAGHTPARFAPETPLELGPDILGRQSISTIRLAFRCENLTTRDQGLSALEVQVSEDSRITDSKQASIQQARLDIALKVAKAASERAYPCLKKVEFPTSAVAPGF